MRRLAQWLTTFVCVSALGMLLSVGAAAQEHPEHPKEKTAEHPEHPEQKTSHSELTKDTLADAIEMYVASLTELQGGQFCMFDAANAEALALTLDKVHRERLAGLGDGTYFACADFKATNGNVYDLDIFMSSAEGGLFNGLMPTQVSVHKQNGKARYTWHEDDGKWKMTKVK